MGSVIHVRFGPKPGDSLLVPRAHETMRVLSRTEVKTTGDEPIPSPADLDDLGWGDLIFLGILGDEHEPQPEALWFRVLEWVTRDDGVRHWVAMLEQQPEKLPMQKGDIVVVQDRHILLAGGQDTL